MPGTPWPTANRPAAWQTSVAAAASAPRRPSAAHPGTRGGLSSLQLDQCHRPQAARAHGPLARADLVVAEVVERPAHTALALHDRVRWHTQPRALLDLHMLDGGIRCQSSAKMAARLRSRATMGP